MTRFRIDWNDEVDENGENQPPPFNTESESNQMVCSDGFDTKQSEVMAASTSGLSNGHDLLADRMVLSGSTIDHSHNSNFDGKLASLPKQEEVSMEM